jgi:6-phosphofructokinase 1
MKIKNRPVKAIAVLTSGGDAPGMNAAIRSVVRYGIFSGLDVYGVAKGYSGLLDGQIYPMDLSSVANIIQRGGTILKTDRCDAFFKKSVRREAAHLLFRKNIDGLVVIGGDGSFAGAYLLEKETGLRTVGVPGTIDNDIFGTTDTIGFDTAVNTGIGAIDRIRDTASSHDRLFLVEVMGRNSGFIAVNVGIGGGAETVIVPEEMPSVSEICKTIDRGAQRGKSSSIIVVAEGPKSGLANELASGLKKRGYKPKVCILGHIQRGGVPTAHDRYLASTMGAQAVRALVEGKTGVMVGIQSGKPILVPFKNIAGKRKHLLKQDLLLAQILAS